MNRPNWRLPNRRNTSTRPLRRHRLAPGLFLALCLNLAIAPALYAATGAISRGNAYALGLLSLVVVGLAIYLTVVIFQPERF
ncbi:MAG: K(+)-transporting ATPase subunit F [Nodosilinea sp.]